MRLSAQAFEAVKNALLSINPDGSELTVDVQNYICYDENNRRLECVSVTDLAHDWGYPVITVYRTID